MCNIFYECFSLKELNLSNFQINNETNMTDMFYGCSEDLKTKNKEQNKNIKVQNIIITNKFKVIKII